VFGCLVWQEPILFLHLLFVELVSTVTGHFYAALYPRDGNLSGPWPSCEAHLVIWEAGWYLLLSSSFLAVLALFVVWWKGRELIVDTNSRYATLILLAILASGAAVMLTMDAMTIALG
jgi:hypothetical protein